MKSVILLAVVIILLIGTLWFEFSMGNKKTDPSLVVSSESQEAPKAPEMVSEKEDAPLASISDDGEYPKVTTEVINGRTERTIHMGVRQWVWEPSVLKVKQGELVRLVIHNADVSHPLVIPDLGIEADVPPEGAVVEFEAKKKGTFHFLCGTYCGEGHMEMSGQIIVE